jgi:hypothetical protein
MKPRFIGDYFYLKGEKTLIQFESDSLDRIDSVSFDNTINNIYHFKQKQLLVLIGGNRLEFLSVIPLLSIKTISFTGRFRELFQCPIKNEIGLIGTFKNFIINLPRAKLK